jgi:hypothetical protein
MPKSSNVEAKYKKINVTGNWSRFRKTRLGQPSLVSLESGGVIRVKYCLMVDALLQIHSAFLYTRYIL